MTTPNKNQQLYCWDFTLSVEHERDEENIKKWLRKVAKKWTFQKEKGEKTGYEHWQGRFSLIVKQTLDHMKKNRPWPMHLSPTSNAHKGDMIYVSKSQTRLEGPWTDKDPNEDEMPFQFKKLKEWRPWQAQIVALLKVKDDRTIHVVYDPVGNKGKSSLANYLGWKQQAKTLPFVNDYKDVMRMVYDMPKVGAYFIDMPRAIKKHKLQQLFGAIEHVKNGFAFDDRNHYKEAYFDSPNIFVFTNDVPDLNMLSNDRWKIWDINKDDELVPHEFEDEEDESYEVDESE